MAQVPHKLTEPSPAKPIVGRSTSDLLCSFEGLQRELERLIDAFGPFGRAPFGVEPLDGRDRAFTLAPSVDVADRQTEYEITAELPGLDERDVEVKIAGGVLTIQGEKKEEKEEKKKNYYLSERRYGAFQRSFAMPDGVDPDKVQARFKKGVLSVILPKSADALKQEKKIPIKAA